MEHGPTRILKNDEAAPKDAEYYRDCTICGFRIEDQYLKRASPCPNCNRFSWTFPYYLEEYTKPAVTKIRKVMNPRIDLKPVSEDK